MGLKIGEPFKDRCFLTVVATGLPATALADVTCTIIDESGNRTVGVVTEESDGWYTCPFTPDIAGTWATEWSKTANPEDYTFHHPYKEFMVGGGQEADIPAILVDTNELQTDWVNGGRLDQLVDIIVAAAGTAGAYAIVNSGLGFRGIVTNVPGANQFKIATLAGLGAGIFVDANAPWYAYVLRDAGGGSGAPQGQSRLVTAYDTADGTFTTAAFAVSPVGVGDDVIIRSNVLQNAIDTLADTNELQTDWVDGGRLDLLIDAIKAQTDVIATTTTFAHQTDAITTFNGIVQNTWYNLLPATTNARISTCCFSTGVTSETIEVEVILDGTTWSWSGAPALAVDYYVHIDPSASWGATHLTAAGTAYCMHLYDSLEAKVAQIRIRKTTNAGVCDVYGKVVWERRI